MITADTNVLVRLLTRDDEAQYQIAYQLFEDEEIFLATTILLETEWVLRFAYDFSPVHIAQALRMLAGLPNATIAEPVRLAKALDAHEQGMDFADALHIYGAQMGSEFATFDKKLAGRAQGIVDLPIRSLG